MVSAPPTGPIARYFYDCEFIEDGRTIELISIGMVAEDGREYYAVSTGFDPGRAGTWVATHVLPQLPPPSDPAWRSPARIREDLLAFLVAPGLPVQLWAWCAAYDHVALVQLWGDMTALPKVIPRFTYEIRQHWEVAGCPPVPKAVPRPGVGSGPVRDTRSVPQRGSGRHEALADARLGYARWMVAEQALRAVTSR